MRVVDASPKTTSGRAIGNQLVRAGTAVGANLPSGLSRTVKGRFIAKLGIVVEEADEERLLRWS